MSAVKIKHFWINKNLDRTLRRKGSIRYVYRLHCSQGKITAGKVSKYGVISGPYFPVFGPEITPYLDTFHAVTDTTMIL